MITHCFKVSKKTLWPFMDELRGHYKGHHPAYAKVLGLSLKCKTKPGNYQESMRLLTDRELTTYLQLFDPGRPYWLFQVLSADNYFEAKAQPLFIPTITPIIFGVDAPLEYRGNGHTANWLAEQIEAQRFMLVPVVDTDMLQGYLAQLAGGRAGDNHASH